MSSLTRYAVRVKRRMPDKSFRYLYVRETLGTKIGSMVHRLTHDPDEAAAFRHGVAQNIAADLASGKTRENRDASVTRYPIIASLGDVAAGRG